MTSNTTATPTATRQIKAGFTAAIHEIDATETIKDQANEIFNEIVNELDWVSASTDEDIRVVWFKLADGKDGTLKGIGIQNHGHAVMLSPGFFTEQGELLTYGFTGSEFISIHASEPEKMIAKVIRRARKLED